MKYENGRDIFPEELLRQIQKYAAGKLVYIPTVDKKRTWGESSGYKQYLLERNQEIRQKYRAGVSMESLASQFYLSCESIRKIVYVRKEIVDLKYKCSLSSAQEYAEHGMLEEWIHDYLLSDGHNKEFSDGLKLYKRHYLGPLLMPLSLFSRCCGPEEGMKWRINGEWFERHVHELEEVIQRETDMPPLIVHFYVDKEHPDGVFELNDGNHRHEAYSRLNIKNYYVIVWATEDNERDLFMQRYAKFMKDRSSAV